MPFEPHYEITPAIARALMRIEAAREAVRHLPITPAVLASLRETARLHTTHYSTMIEGNRLSEVEIKELIKHQGHFAGRERDEKEVLGYYAALDHTEMLFEKQSQIRESDINRIHALVMGGGKQTVKPTPYRDGQNVIRDSATRSIVYMPPEAKDVGTLMNELSQWIKAQDELPAPLKAGIAHYQYATIHPYYDGNGRTARLMTTLILHQSGYGLKGLYSLEEYYARNLPAYYKALSLGPSHNYYLGRASADITAWVEYFCMGVAESFEAVKRQAASEARKGVNDTSPLLRKLDARQRKALELFRSSELISSQDIAKLFGLQARAARVICQKWVETEFIIVNDPSKKSRTYAINQQWQSLVN
jgi:Fic family protein